MLSQPVYLSVSPSLPVKNDEPPHLICDECEASGLPSGLVPYEVQVNDLTILRACKAHHQGTGGRAAIIGMEIHAWGSSSHVQKITQQRDMLKYMEICTDLKK